MIAEAVIILVSLHEQGHGPGGHSKHVYDNESFSLSIASESDPHTLKLRHYMHALT